jgi:hypothetical protein
LGAHDASLALSRIVTAGSPPGMSGTTNMVRVHRIGEDDSPKAVPPIG